MYAVPSDFPPGVIGICTGELSRFTAWANCIAGLQVPSGSIPRWEVGPLIGASLEKIFFYTLEQERSWVWLMGDDHTFPRNILLNLLAREKDVVIPLCLNRLPPLDPTIVDFDKNLNFPLEDLPEGGMFKLTGSQYCGDAGMLIRSNVLKAIGPPWYERLVTGALGGSEDRYFAKKIRDAGFDIWVDTDNPIGHIGVVTYMPVRTEKGWAVRIMGSDTKTQIVDIRPQRRLK